MLMNFEAKKSFKKQLDLKRANLLKDTSKFLR
jgi:hypothetical protein